MSTLGKVLAILNVFAALALVCLAALDWGQRQVWTYAVFRHDLLLRGLPLDAEERDADGVAIADQLGNDTLTKLFAQAGGQPVKTQVEEVRRKYDDFRRQMDAANEEGRAQKLREILLPVVRTGAERDALRNAKLEELEAKLQSEFKPALEGKDAQDHVLEDGQRRLAIAHVLYTTSSEQEFPRVVVVVGLETYARAVEGQALLLRDMAQRVERIQTEDRTSFEVAHRALVQRVQVLGDRLADVKLSLDQYRAEATKHGVLVNARTIDIKELQVQIAEARADTQAALKEQERLQQALFQAQRSVGQAVDENQLLEKQIRSRERAD